MNIEFSKEDLSFKEQVEGFLDAELDKDVQQRVLSGLRVSKKQKVQWQRSLWRQGWIAPSWPAEFGGTGWSPTRKYIFEHSCALYGAPEVVPFGLKMVGPVIYTYGNEAQKKRFLPKILSSEHWWCQGFSEADAGSDLASLRTTGVRQGDRFIVNGSKTWTSFAQHADWMFCLVRSSDFSLKNQQAISFLLIDMNSPGVTVSPITTIDGHHEVNEVHLDNVSVPIENLVGDEGNGWSYAKMLLAHERTNIAKVAISKQRLGALREKMQAGTEGLNDDPLFNAKVSLVEIELRALEVTEMRALCAVEESGSPGSEASILKIKGTEVAQKIDELFVELVGYSALPFVNNQFYSPDHNEYHVGKGSDVDRAPWYFNNRKASIYGGSNEVQKMIIAKSVLKI